MQLARSASRRGPARGPRARRAYCMHARTQVKSICEELQTGFLGVGFDPKWGIPEIPMMPKVRSVLPPRP